MQDHIIPRQFQWCWDIWNDQTGYLLAFLNNEISLADKQLSEKGLNNEKVFAYPYGGTSVEAISILKENNYALAFTTKHGNIMCKNQSLELPRIRVGNRPLSSFGL